MFDAFRRSLENLVNGATSPEARREALSHMKDTLVKARLGVDDLRRGVAETRARLAVEQRELETVRRRRALAEGIGDRETVGVAERFERHHAERVDALERKLLAQEGEVMVVEREVAEMTAELRRAMSGVGPTVAAPRPGASVGADVGSGGEQGDAALDDDASAATREAIDALARERRRAERDASAEERLAALKRKMGK